MGFQCLLNKHNDIQAEQAHLHCLLIHTSIELCVTLCDSTELLLLPMLVLEALLEQLRLRGVQEESLGKVKN